MDDCIFCKIVGRGIPAEKVYEDEVIFAFKDIHPKARVHVLIVPKEHVASVMELSEAQGELVGKMVLAAKQIAAEQGLEGYRLLINVGEKGGQEVFHLHLHLMGE